MAQRTVAEILAQIQARRTAPETSGFGGSVYGDEPANPAPTPPPQVEDDAASPGWGKYGGMATRALGAIVGNSGGWWGAGASGLSEAAAEKMEGRDINPWQVGFQSVLGAIPLGRVFGKGVSLAGSAIRGALFSTAGTAGTALADKRLPTVKELETSALVGGATGGALRGMQRALTKEGPVAARALNAEERVPSVPRVAQPIENEAVRMARAEQPAMNFDIATPEQGSQLAQEAILGSHAVAARYSKMQAALAASQGKTSALIDRLSMAARRAEARAAGTVEPELASASQRPMFTPEEMTGLTPSAKVPPTPPTPALQNVTPPVPPRIPGAPIVSSRITNMQADLERQYGGRMNSFVGDPEFVNAVPPDVKNITPIPTPIDRRSPLTTSLRDLMDEARATREGTPRVTEDIDPVMAPQPDVAPAPLALAGRTKPHVPAPVTALWQRLKPKWDATLAAQENDQIPFKVDPHEDLVSFSERIKHEDPSQLMGAEKKVRKLLDEQQGGFISPELAARLGLTVAGGATGAVVDKEHPLRGALIGAGGGAALGSSPAILRALKSGTFANKAEALRYFSMLSGPTTQAKNIIGNVGAVAAHSLENRTAEPLRQLFSSKTLQDLTREFKSPQPGRWGNVHGPLGVPGRAMGAVDAATKDALKRAGITLEDARRITFTNTPTSQSGKALVNFFRQAGPAARLVVPFSQTATNIVERGIERTPGLGILADYLSKGELKTSAAKQLLGLAAVAGGSQFGKLPPVLQAALAPYSLPYSMGVGARDALDKNQPWDDAAMNAWNEALKLVPAPMDKRAFDPRQWLAQMVPNALREADPVDQTTLDPNSVPIIGQALQKFPVLNAALLKQKKLAKKKGLVPMRPRSLR